MYQGLKQSHFTRNSSLAALLAAAAVLGACGGSSPTSSNNPSPAGSSPAMVTAGDAPMSSVLAALVTVSAVSVTSASGTVQLLNQPRPIELTHLGGIRAPLDDHALPQGTYTSLSLTVSAAKITYIDPVSGQPVTANTTIPAASATATITLNPALVVNSTAATDIRFDFDLQKSLDLTGSVVTFTPVISAAAAKIEGESDDERDIDINGTVSAVDTSKSTITLTTDDTGLSVTLNVTSATEFGDSMTLASLQAGTEIHSEDRLNSDGTMTVLSVENANGGSAVDDNSRVDGGIVTAVTLDSNNVLTSFTMVVRDSVREASLGQALTVQVNSGTLFKDTLTAQTAGLANFDATQVFPGQGVWVAGTKSGTGTVLATEVRPAAVNPFGLTSAAVQTGSSSGFVISLLLDANTSFAKFANLSTLTVDTNASTVFDGQTLTSTTVANLAVGTPLVARGFLSLSGTTITEFCNHLHEPSPEN